MSQLSPTEVRQIRHRIYEKVQPFQNLIPVTVSYATAGNLLIVGPEDLIRLAETELPDGVSATLLAAEPISNTTEEHLNKVLSIDPVSDVLLGRIDRIKGFLGQYEVFVRLSQNQVSKETASEHSIELAPVAIKKPHFDFIIDMCQKPLLAQDLLPPGYFYVGHNQTTVKQVTRDLRDYLGEFEKPRYAKVNAQVCAHSANDLIGCTRCLDVCSAEAIISRDFSIEIDPYLCHGSGSCSSVCPTGAIEYDLPPPIPMFDYIQRLIQAYLDEANKAPIILFVDQNSQSSCFDQNQIPHANLPDDILPVGVEEIGVVSCEHILSALAWGAKHVVIVKPEQVTPSVLSAMEGQIDLANAVLSHIELEKAVSFISFEPIREGQESQETESFTPIIKVKPAEFTVSGKRQAFYQAVDHLNKQASACSDALAQPSLSFGKVDVDQDNCTLCMSCVSACPTQSLLSGKDKPLLSFIEQDCVQCGLCEQSCPEKVISLSGQINFDHKLRQSPQVLKQEAAFHCIRCDVPFATVSMVEKMQSMLSEHSAFKGNSQRLQMCSDCRVKDMVEDVIADPHLQLR